jgi:hypothetical protein
MVEKWKDHPAILFWLVGNEVNVNLGGNDLCLDWYPQLDSMAQAAHTLEGSSFHPVGTANADNAGLTDICQAGCSDDTSLPNVDLWAVQAYRGCTFGTLFTEYQKPDCDRPLVVTEFGMDAWDSLLGSENQILQANCLESLLVDANQDLAVNKSDGVSSGQVMFEWLDEWWKAECDPGTDWAVQDTCASFTNPAYPDPAINEEWWGLVSQDAGNADTRNLRESFTRVSYTLFGLGPVCDMKVDTYNAGTGSTGLSYGPSDGAANHTLYYGPLSAVSTYGYSGLQSNLGISGSSSVTLPAGDLFWVVVGRTLRAEGGYGTSAIGPDVDERPPSPAAPVPQLANRSNQCP